MGCHFVMCLMYLFGRLSQVALKAVMQDERDFTELALIYVEIAHHENV